MNRPTLDTDAHLNMGMAHAAEQVAKHRAALEQCVRVVKMWHGDDCFDLYFNHSPEMKPIRDILGKMPEEA